MYKERPFFADLAVFKRVFLEVPLGLDVDPVRFNIAPQPVFNKNFELLAADIREKIYNAFNREGIEIPFPQRDIHIITEK